MLQVGDKMPSFAAADETGKMVTDKDLIGKKTVIYFYPKDSTPGCTAEACNIRDNYHAFLAQGYQVFGVREVNDVVGVTWKHDDTLDFVATYFIVQHFVCAFLAELDESVTCNNDKLFPLGIVPMLTFSNTWF